MRFEQLDLNLLVILDAFLQERSVSRAAERVNISQSGASASLARLREFFQDELLVKAGRTMILTARGQRLRQPVHLALEHVRETITTDRPFDPRTSDRTISIAAMDVVVQVFLGAAISALASEAPEMRFQISALKVDDYQLQLARGECDLSIALEHMLDDDCRHEWLYDDRLVVVGWSGNLHVAKPMTRALYKCLGHVSAHFEARGVSFEDVMCRALGSDRRVEVFAPNFTSIARFLIGTDRIATMHERLARQLADSLPIAIVPLPMPAPKFREFAQWTKGNANDPAINWVVQRLKAFAASAPFTGAG